MARLIWSPRARGYLAEIAAFFATRSARAADRTVRAILRAAASIPAQPFLGAEVPEYEDEAIRERQVRSYRLVYEVRNGDIYILLVWPATRPLPEDPHG